MPTDECPLSGVKRTSSSRSPMSANDPKQTYYAEVYSYRWPEIAISTVVKKGVPL